MICTIWKAGWRKSRLNSTDPLQKALDGLVESAVEMMEHRRSATGRQDALLGSDDGELIEGPERVTFILHAPGYWEEDLHAAISDGALEVKAPDFTVVRRLPPDVDASLMEKAFTNGVLSITLSRLR